MAIPEFRIRVEGREYGPFTEARIRGWIQDRELSDDPNRDGWLDESTGSWKPLKERFGRAPTESAPSFLETITIHNTYQRVLKAAVVLFIFWGLVFCLYRLWVGKWPGQGAAQHHNPVQTDLPEASTVPAGSTWSSDSVYTGGTTSSTDTHP